MSLSTRRILLLLVVFTFSLLAAACGRDEISNRSCSVDEDCASGEACVDGFCVVDETNNLNNQNNNNDSCQSNADCPDGEVCDVMSGACIEDTCMPTEDGRCVNSSGEACDVGCAPTETQVGCECEPVACVADDECEGFVCVDGVCAACKDDEQCGEGLACQDDGTCVEDNSCLSDEECEPTQECRGGMCLSRPGCVIDSDCDEDELCISGVCIFAPECESDEQCEEGFECVANNCLEEVCRGPEDCEGELICDAGECVEPPPALSCFVVTPDGLITDGQVVPLEAFAQDADGNGVAARFLWSSSETNVADVGPSGSNAIGGTDAGVAVFTATLANGDPIQCTGEARLTNPGPVTMGQLRVSVIQAETGAPVAGATVEVGNASAQTSSGGLAAFTQPMGDYDVTVRHPDFNWVTVQGISNDDVVIPLSLKAGTGPIGGFTGEFDTSQITASGDITLGLAGASIPGGLLELDLTAILGEPFVTPINIPGLGGDSFPIPGGLIAYGGAFGFQLDIKRDYYATAPAGGKIAWGLAGKVPLNELISLAQGGGGGDDLLTTLLPLFNRFDHGSRPINVTALPRITDTADIDGDGDTAEIVPDYNAFPTETIQPRVRQTLATDVNVSNFPQLPGGTAELALLVGGTLLNSPGLVPLGISATSDEDGDGRPDTRRLTIAPPAGSLAGGRYTLVALAFRTDGFGGSFDFPANVSVALWNGQSFPSSIALGTFPDQSVVSVDDTTRTLDVQADAGPLYRVRMVGAERSWDVWTLGPAGVMGSFNHSITIPAAPMGGPDFFANGQILLDAIQTNVTLNSLVSASGVGVKNAGLVSTAFNRTEVR